MAVVMIFIETIVLDSLSFKYNFLNNKIPKETNPKIIDDIQRYIVNDISQLSSKTLASSNSPGTLLNLKNHIKYSIRKHTINKKG